MTAKQYAYKCHMSCQWKGSELSVWRAPTNYIEPHQTLQPPHLQCRFDFTNCVLIKYDDRNNLHSIILCAGKANFSSYQRANSYNSLRNLREKKTKTVQQMLITAPTTNLSGYRSLHNIFIICLSFSTCSGTIASTKSKCTFLCQLLFTPIAPRQGEVCYGDMMRKCLS